MGYEKLGSEMDECDAQFGSSDVTQGSYNKILRKSESMRLQNLSKEVVVEDSTLNESGGKQGRSCLCEVLRQLGQTSLIVGWDTGSRFSLRAGNPT